MNPNQKNNRASTEPTATIIVMPVDASRRRGNLRAVTLTNQSVNVDRLHGVTKIMQVLVDDVFGKSLCDVQPYGVFK